MPRAARQISITQVYHVMLRGNERKEIFLEDEDKTRFIDILYDKKQDNSFSLHAYCILDNHVHLIIKEQKDSISQIMKRIGTSYAYYYNKKYKRVGHVFQDRYKSEAVEDERYLMTVIRYIHNNPEKAGICKKQQYKWSSYQHYTQQSRDYIDLLEYEDILNMFSKDRKRAIILFRKFSNKEDEGNFIDMEEVEELLDEEEAIEHIKDYLLKNGITLEHLNQSNYRIKRDALIRELINKSNLSLRRIAEVLEINRETVRKVKLSEEPSP